MPPCSTLVMPPCKRRCRAAAPQVFLWHCPPLTPTARPYVASFPFPALHPWCARDAKCRGTADCRFPRASPALRGPARFALWQPAAAAGGAGRGARGGRRRPPALISQRSGLRARRGLWGGPAAAASRTWPGTAPLRPGKGPRCREEPPRWKRLDELVSWAGALNSRRPAASHICSPRWREMKGRWGCRGLWGTLGMLQPPSRAPAGPFPGLGSCIPGIRKAIPACVQTTRGALDVRCSVCT